MMSFDASVSSLSTAPAIGCPPILGESFSEYSGFTLGEHIGNGRFASVYSGSSTTTDRQVAIKVEPKSKVSMLHYEVRAYKSLCRGGDSKAPKVHWHGSFGDYNIIVMDMLGPSVDAVFTACGRAFSQNVIATIGMGMISGIEYLHTKGFIHRNIAPWNVVFASASLGKVHLIGLSLAKKYIDKTRHHIPMQKSTPLLSPLVTTDFSSMRSHCGDVQQSRRDDLEAVGHILVYLTKGSLPWMGRNINSAEVCMLKAGSVVEPYCPSYIAKFVRCARALSFAELPKYRYLRSLLRKAGLPRPRVSVPKWSTFHEYNFVSDWRIHVVPTEKKALIAKAPVLDYYSCLSHF